MMLVNLKKYALFHFVKVQKEFQHEIFTMIYVRKLNVKDDEIEK
jgi:hypothetical protein